MKRRFDKNKTDNSDVANIKRKRNRNLKYKYWNTKSNTKKVIEARNHIIEIKNEFNTKENFELNSLNASGLNKALGKYFDFDIEECFKESKNQRKALSLLKEILKGTPPNEIYTMMDFLKNLLASKSLKTQKINKNKTEIPKINNDRTTER